MSWELSSATGDPRKSTTVRAEGDGLPESDQLLQECPYVFNGKALLFLLLEFYEHVSVYLLFI